MAVATGTALAISAGVGLVGTGVSTAMSFSQASKQRKAQEKAEREADEKMREARARLEVNYADALSIQKEPYERQREALLSAGAQALEQGVESERGGAATAGRVLAAQTEAQGQVRDQMNKDLFDLEAMKAEEASRLRDINAQMDLQEVAGAQQAAAEAEEKAALARQQGVQGALNFVQQGVGMLPMFGASGTHTNKLFTPEALNTATPATARSQALAQQFPNLYGNNTPGAPLQFGGNSNFSRFTPQVSGLNYQPSTNLNPFAITNSGFGGYGSGYGGFGGYKFP